MSPMVREGEGLRFVLQWTRSHQYLPNGRPLTEGNNRADLLAAEGMRLASTLQGADRNPWVCYSMKAATRRAEDYFRGLQQTELSESIGKTRYGEVFEDLLERERALGAVTQGGHRWGKYHLRELREFSRDSIRILLGLRTGHNKLGHHTQQFITTRNDDGICSCSRPERQDLKHLISCCTLPDIQRHRHTLHRTALDLYSRDRLNDPVPRGLIALHSPLTYLYPLCEDKEVVKGLKEAIIHFYRQVVGYRHQHLDFPDLG